VVIVILLMFFHGACRRKMPMNLKSIRRVK
jgi:hypothetical protein